MLLNAFLAGARKAGADTSTLVIPSLQIAACDDCDGCASDGKCIIEDDFQFVAERIIASDVIVLSAPLYFAALPAQVKCLIDRSHCQWVRRYRLHVPLPPSNSGQARRRGILLSSAGDHKANFEGMRRTVRYFFNVYETDYADELLIAGVDAKERIDEDKLQRANILGERTCTLSEHD